MLMKIIHKNVIMAITVSRYSIVHRLLTAFPYALAQLLFADSYVLNYLNYLVHRFIFVGKYIPTNIKMTKATFKNIVL